MIGCCLDSLPFGCRILRAHPVMSFNFSYPHFAKPSFKRMPQCTCVYVRTCCNIRNSFVGDRLAKEACLERRHLHTVYSDSSERFWKVLFRMLLRWAATVPALWPIGRPELGKKKNKCLCTTSIDGLQKYNSIDSYQFKWATPSPPCCTHRPHFLSNLTRI